MEKKRVIVTKYNNKYFTTEIKETFEEYIQTLKSNFLLPNEYSIEFINAKYKKVVINDNDSYQKLIKANVKLNKIRAFIIEHLNNTQNIRRAHSETILSKQIFDKIEKKEKKPKKKKKKQSGFFKESLPLSGAIGESIGINIKLIKLAPPRIPSQPTNVKKGSN